MADLNEPELGEPLGSTSIDSLDCTLCMFDLDPEDPENIVLPCDCRFHQECLQICFQHAIEKESSFPAKCGCKERIRLSKVVKRLIGKTILESYFKASDEYASSNRLYCYDKDCGAFIPNSSRTDKYGQCGCGKKTCISCNNESHEGHCVPDANEEALKDLFEKEGWQKCPKCNRRIERISGCNQVNCHCGFQLCFACGGPWGECECSDSDEDVYDREEALNEALGTRRVTQHEEDDDGAGDEAEENASTCDHSGDFVVLNGVRNCTMCLSASNEIFRCLDCKTVACFACFRGGRRHPTQLFPQAGPSGSGAN